MDAALLLKKDTNPRIPKFSAGDTVRVNFRIREGERERIQVFQGVVIRLQNGKGPAASFTVRRITAGIGIERVFPLHSPLVESLEVTRYGSVRRAKLYYLRGLQGRAARIKELNPVQRRKAQEAAAAELSEKTAADEAQSEDQELEEASVDIEDRPRDLAEKIDGESLDEPIDELEVPIEEPPEHGTPAGDLKEEE